MEKIDWNNFCCKNCGCSAESMGIKENSMENIRCPFCGTIYTLKDYNPDKYDAVCNDKEKKLNSILSNYKATRNNAPVIAELNTDTSMSYDLIRNIWFGFIIEVAKLARDFKDTELMRRLKKYAQDTGDHLLKRSIAEENTGALAEYELRSKLEDINGDVEKFAGDLGLNKEIIDHIKRDKDIQFIVEIFYLIKSKGEEWKSVGEEYLKAIFDDKDGTILNIFNDKNYFNTSAGRQFIKDVKKYIKSCLKKTLLTIGFAGGTAEVWKHVENVQKKRQKNILIALSCCLVVAIASLMGMGFYFNSANKDTITINVDKVIETIYGEALDLSSYTVTYQKNSGAKVTEIITEKMLLGFDPEAVGIQQTVYIEYAGVRTGITVIVNPATLATPVLVQSGNFITWEFVPNAIDYNVYINSSSSPTLTTTNLSYDLSSNANHGILTVTVRANASSVKYNNSVLSESLSITKLISPSNLVYEDGELKWDVVPGASVYELSINGTPYTTSFNYYKIDFVQGDNQITINAKSSDSSVVEGIVKQTIYYYRLNPVSSMSYRDNRVCWESEDKVSTFALYVDGNYWRDFNRNYFVIDSDSFATIFGESVHTIGVVCKSSVIGTVPSEMASFTVAIGNRLYFDDGILRWTHVGSGATYFVSINGSSSLILSSPFMAVSDVQWQEGINTVSVTSMYDNQETICETVSVTKLSKPTLSVAYDSWVIDGNSGNRFKLNNGEWLSQLPDIDSLAAGEYSVAAQKISASDSAFEIDSDIVEIKIIKPSAPIISVGNEQVLCEYDSDKYKLKLYYSNSEGGSCSEISSLGEIRSEGEYYLKARLTEGVPSSNGIIISSDYSVAVQITKLSAPLVYYNNGDDRVTSDKSGVKFYYMLDGEEFELKDGLISNLPGGVFSVYARKMPETANELTSENTPIDKRVSIFNMNITLSINKMTSSQSQLYAIFGGCEDINKLTYTYEIKYYNKDGNYIGHKEVSNEVVSEKNENVSNENIVTTINYRLDVVFEPGYGQTDIFKVELIVRISSGSDGQILSAVMNV